jgi:hypothetical protein
MVLAYQGIDYTREKNVLDVGSVHLTAETHERLSLPPMLGGLLLIGGVVVLVRGQATSHRPGLRIGPVASERKGMIGVKFMRGNQDHKRKGDLQCYY